MSISRPVRIGVQLEPLHTPYKVLHDRVREVEDLGVDIIFNSDHFFPTTGDPDGAHFEALSLLSAWAEQTSRVELGTLVTSNGYRNPDLLADMARTIDHISHGRFILGIGAGWFELDYTEYGYPFGTQGERLEALEQALPRIKSRWNKLNPPPTRKVPVLIGGDGERKTLRIVAQHADIWHSFADPETLRRKLHVLRMHGEIVGRDVSSIEISNEVRDRDILATDRLHAEGVTLFTMSMWGEKYDAKRIAEWVRWRDSTNA